jgi:nicotinate-nucleotide adenylyltransferase
LPKPSYTSTTLAYLSEKNPEHEFSIIMGSDSFQNINKWKNPETILGKYHIYIYRRPGFEVDITAYAKVEIVQAPLLEISATHIREYIRNKKSVRYMLPDKVLEEIEKGGYYKK